MAVISGTTGVRLPKQTVPVHQLHDKRGMLAHGSNRSAKVEAVLNLLF